MRNLLSARSGHLRRSAPSTIHLSQSLGAEKSKNEGRRISRFRKARRPRSSIAVRRMPARRRLDLGGVFALGLDLPVLSLDLEHAARTLGQ
jgi:hypothetical protein